MDFEDVILRRRTIRRFKQDPIPMETLKKLIDFARVAPAGSNIQALEYIIITDSEIRKNLFPYVAWAGSLPPEMRVPEEDRRPTAYIIVLENSKIKKNANFDVGASVENILLGAANFGLGSCWMGSINRNEIQKLLEIPDYYEITHVISLGFPDEESMIEAYDGSFKYWKDELGVMHVPKKQLNDVIFKIFD